MVKIILGISITLGVGIILIAGLMAAYVNAMQATQKKSAIRSRDAKTVIAKEKVRQFETAVKNFYKKECRFPKSGVSSDKKVKPDFSDGGFSELDLSIVAIDFIYFEYRLLNEGKKLTIIAEIDFLPDDPTKTSHKLVLNAGPNCTIRSEPIVSVREKEVTD